MEEGKFSRARGSNPHRRRRLAGTRPASPSRRLKTDTDQGNYSGRRLQPTNQYASHGRVPENYIRVSLKDKVSTLRRTGSLDDVLDERQSHLRTRSAPNSPVIKKRTTGPKTVSIRQQGQPFISNETLVSGRRTSRLKQSKSPARNHDAQHRSERRRKSENLKRQSAVLHSLSKSRDDVSLENADDACSEISEFSFLYPDQVIAHLTANVQSEHIGELIRIVSHNARVSERRLSRIEENQAFLEWKYQSIMTEQLKKKKQEQAAAREQIFLKNDQSKAKTKAEDKPAVAADDPVPAPDDIKPEEKKPTVADTSLPAMRKKRAESIAKRKQRPIINPALDIDYKKKVEEQPTPPRSASPIEEAISDDESPPDISPEEAKIDTEVAETKVTEADEIKEEVPAQEPTEDVTVEDITEKKDIAPEEDMVAVKAVTETDIDAPDGVVSADSESTDFLPELPTATRKLEHVTKGRARPARRVQKKPAVKEDSDKSVDDFFSASVTSTDFEKVPTLDEEKKENEKEITPKKPRGFGLPGMGQITPDMLKKRRKDSGGSDKDGGKKEKESTPQQEAEEEHSVKNGEDAETEDSKSEPVAKRRPPGAMGLPGMGFGGNVLAEMKLKKLNRSKTSDKLQGESSKPDSEQSSALPFGRGMLKKTGSPAEKKEDNNSNNNNNNNAARKPDLSRWKSKSFDKEKPQVSSKPVSKVAMLPRKPSPPPLSAKPAKGSPPPLPTKPKPAPRPDSVTSGARSRPVSEFVDPKRVPSSIKQRAASWGKKDSK